MGWASGHIERLNAGHTVSFRPRGHSMSPKINDRQLVTVEPMTAERGLVVGDIVLCRVGGREYTHLVKAMKGDRFLIGNNRGGTNGWVGRLGIFGVVVRVDE